MANLDSTLRLRFPQPAGKLLRSGYFSEFFTQGARLQFHKSVRFSEMLCKQRFASWTASPTYSMENTSRRTCTLPLVGFDLATMLVVTAAFALLFTGMTVLNSHFVVFAYFSGLIAFVGIAQSVLSERYNPRSVSLAAGVAYNFAVTMICLFIVAFFDRQQRWHADALICPLLFSPALGYLSGVLVAGTFLVADQLRGLLIFLHLHRSIDEEHHEVRSPWDE